MTDKRQAKTAVNSIDFISHVERLPTFRSNASGIYLYGADNNYPYKLKQLALRSNSLVTAVNTYSRFLQGLGFEGATANDVLSGNSLFLNRNKLTPYDLLKFSASEKGHINFAVHVNFNQLGEAVEFTPIPYEFCRLKTKIDKEIFDKYIITNIWHSERDLNYYGAFSMQNFNKWKENKIRGYHFTSLETYAYNPDSFVVREQIKESGGIENYPGQLFYVKDTIEVYQLAKYDSIIDDGQIEAEAKLFSLSNLQNSFSASGILKYPGNLDSNDEFVEAKDRLRNLTGSQNAGRFITMPYLPANPPSINLFENIQQNDIDKLFTTQKEEAKRNIYELFSQPGIINGRSDNGMFNQQSMQDAFMFYNSVTEPARQQLEIELTTLFSNSVFESQIKLPIEIKPLEYGEKTTNNEKIN